MVFHSSCTILHSHQQCRRVPGSHPCQHLSVFFLLAFLVGMKQCLVVVWICIFLVTNGVLMQFQDFLSGHLVIQQMVVEGHVPSTVGALGVPMPVCCRVMLCMEC